MAPGLVAFLAFASLTLLYSQLPRERYQPRIPHVLALWLALAVALAATVAATGGPRPVPRAVTNLATYLFLGEAFIFVYALPIGSLSIRLLVSMRELESEPDAFRRTLRACSPDRFLGVRLRSLVAQGLLVEREGRYRITPRGRRWAHVGVAVKRVLAVGAGG